LPETPLTSPKILYIDDDSLNRTLVKRVLSGYNFEVIEAATGLEGLTIARNDPPNLILMDINMPGLDGHETTTRMRTIPALERIPIIALTARAARGERELALAAGCDGYITKPIDIDNFPHKIISYLQGQKDTISSDERQLYLGHYSHKLVERLEAKVLELEEANSRLQKIDKVKSDFITVAAHELRTPLTLVYGYARLLQMVAHETGQAELVEGGVSDLAGRIYRSVQRLNEVVNDILNISLIEANEMRLQLELVNLAEVINTALQELNPAKNGRRLNISIDNLDNLPNFKGDKERLRQAFWNILSNAIKYTPDGGFIWVKGWLNGSAPADAELPASCWSVDEEGIILLVKDSGMGIDRLEQKEIFKQFYVIGDTSYHSSSKTAFGGGGIGLGLPITRGIIAAHGGQVWVESDGRNLTTYPGSKFFVFLPLKSPPQQAM
jgi:signal transduction histidine kinase